MSRRSPGGIRSRMRRGFCIAISVAILVPVWGETANAKTVKIEGTFAEWFTGAPFTDPTDPDCSVDPSTSTVTCGFVGTMTTYPEGSLIGQATDRGSFTYNYVSDTFKGEFETLFTGYLNGSRFGQLRFKGTWRASNGASQFHAEARLIEATGDFAGAKGENTWEGGQVHGNLVGTYSGKLVFRNT